MIHCQPGAELSGVAKKWSRGQVSVNETARRLY
jgi:hypothetical protein